MSNLLSDLITATESVNEQEIIKLLKSFQDQETQVQLTDAKLINNLLCSKDQEILKLSTSFAAEIAKNANNRKILTNPETIKCALSLLNSNKSEIVFNSIRTVGNICYENEEACNILEGHGIMIFLKILEKDDTRETNEITTKTLGLLVNLVSLHEGLARSALKEEIVTILDQLLSKYSKGFKEHEEKNGPLIKFLLSLLTNLSDYFGECGIVLSETSCKNIVGVCKVSNCPEISVSCLEIFHSQSERDEIKFLLAREGVCELLFELIERHRHKVNDEDSRAVLKMACDLIVVILTEDDCMYMLYNKGEGEMYKNMITWLDTDDDDLMSTGVLAIGNFARKDTHCLQMVKYGISKKLINILKRYNTSTNVADVKIQHALLSTLKNLLIPKLNKVQILKEGLIEVIYPMIKIEQYLVVFKLLGTFRMAVDGQESAALELISQEEFVEKLVYWCYNSDHLGVRGEVPRLLAWLIKYSHSFKPFKRLIDIPGSVKCLVEMISSNHALMQNESFHALYLLCIGCSRVNTEQNGYSNSDHVEEVDAEHEKLMEVLIEADTGKNIHFVVNKYGEKMDKHTIENLLTLLEHLLKSRKVLDHLNASEVRNSLLKLYTNPNGHDMTERLDKVTSLLLEE